MQWSQTGDPELQDSMQEQDICDLLHVVRHKEKNCLLIPFCHIPSPIGEVTQTDLGHFSQLLYKFR